jgi:hypothetical protein
VRAVARRIDDPPPDPAADPGPAPCAGADAAADVAAAPSFGCAVAAADVAAASSFVVAAALVGIVVATGDAGPYGGALVIAGGATLLGLAPAAVALGLRLARRRRHRSPATGRLVVASLAVLALAVVLVPVGDAVRSRLEARRADDVVHRLDAAARRCATTAVTAVPEEPDPPSAATVRPRLTDRFHGCLQAAARPVVDQLSCTPAGCFTTLVDLTHVAEPAVIVDSPAYLDAELRRRTGERYDRTGRGVRVRRPPGAGGTFRTERGD